MATGAPTEAELYARYLLGDALRRGPLPPAVNPILERYRRARSEIDPAGASRGERAVADFAASHPWSLPFLDAACGLVQRHGLLRGRLLLMSALLEASPRFADRFLPRPSGRTRLALRLAKLSVTATGKAAIGLLLYPLTRLNRP